MPQPTRLKPPFPRLNRSHPLAQGLVLDAILHEGAGNKTTEIASGAVGTLTGLPTWQNGRYGKELKFNSAANNVVTFSEAAHNNIDAVSFEFIVYLNGVGESSNGRLLSKGTATTRYQIAYNDTTNTASLNFQIPRSTTAASWITPANSFALGNYYHIIISEPSVNAFTTPTIYINGILQVLTTVSAGSGTINADTTGLYLGSSATTIRDFDGNFVLARMRNRILSGQEVAQLYADPFQIYRKRTLLRP